MRKFILMAIMILSGLGGFSPMASAEVAYDSKLNCTLTKYANSAQAKKLTKEWLRPNQRHSIIRTEGAAYSFFSSHWRPMRGTITEDQPKKVSWNYKYTQKTTREAVRVKYHFTWFPHNGKLAARVTFPGYQTIETVWGTCTEKKTYASRSSSSKNNSYKADTTQPRKKLTNQLLAVPVSTHHWNLIRVSGTTKIFYHKFEDAIMIASHFELADKLEQRLKNNEHIPLKFGFMWNSDRVTPLKFDFDLQQPKVVQFGRFENLDAVIIRDKSVKAILQNEKKYLFVWLQDGDDGAWAWRRTHLH